MNRIRNARKLNKLTQEQLAKALKVGRTTVTMWETSSQNPDNDTLRRLSTILHVPSDYLIGAGVFGNWAEIMENSEAVYNALRKIIPGDYLDPIDDHRYLLANLDIAFFHSFDELFLIQWFSSAVKSVTFTDRNEAEIVLMPIFAASIRVHQEKKQGNSAASIQDLSGDYQYTAKSSAYSEEPKVVGIKIPVIGSIPAGIPVEAIEDIIDWEEIPESMLAGDKEYFALEVKGDSMWPAYLPGDIVIVQKQPCCESGDVCVVYVNGYDATLKQVKVDEDGSVSLIPQNPEYPPRTYSPEEVQSLPVTICGVVVELRRKIQKGTGIR